MNRLKLKDVKTELLRFSTAVSTLEAAREADKKEVDEANRDPSAQRRYNQDFPKLTGAVRRASMDLTRALAELRRP